MASAQCSRVIKLETPQIAVKASANAFYEIATVRADEVAIASPHKVDKVELVQGQWGKPGSVYQWHYLLDGKREYSKAVVDAKSCDNYKFASYKQIEGNCLKLYKSFTWNVYITPNGEGSLIKWSVEYEKHNETDPEAHSRIDFLVEHTGEVDAYLCKKQ